MNLHRCWSISYQLCILFIVWLMVWVGLILSIAIGLEFPEVRNSHSEDALSPMPAAQAAMTMRLPEGFKANLFAAEPDVQNPIAMTWDEQGRLWVAENYTYADRKQRFDLSLLDRLLILEDLDGDGKMDTRKVFCDNVQMLTSVEVGAGGVWLMCPPQLLFIPDVDTDGVPDAAARVVLDGFTVARDNYHNFANGLKFGPDGWLYGRCGHSCPGRIGLPGTPDEQRVPIDGGIWRFCPKRQVFEVLCHGTVNPWGHDWDANGELFFINTVIGHLWHVVPGCHFKESFGESNNRRVYERMDTIADHYHFDRNGDLKDTNGIHDLYGGGHAHSGMMIYQGSDWPEQYHHRLFTLNMHGRRANVERLERLGSGYVGRHEADFMFMQDPFFRGIDLSTGPDGSCYVIDWSDTGECHEHDGVHRLSGRIYRITYGETGTRRPFVKPPCAAGPGKLPELWAEYRAGHTTEKALLDLLLDQNEHVRTWAIRLLTDDWPLDWLTGPSPHANYPETNTICEQLVELAVSEPSGLVRRQLASTLQRLPVNERLPLARALVHRWEDSRDVELSLLVWYGVSPLSDSQPQALVQLANDCRWPHLTRSIAICLAGMYLSNPEAMDGLLRQGTSYSADLRQSIIEGMVEGFRGVRQAKRPEHWPMFSDALTSNKGARTVDLLRNMNLIFGDGLALQQIKQIVSDSNMPLKDRQRALQTLIDVRPDDLRALCESLLDSRVLNYTAAKGLVLFDDQRVAQLLIKKFSRFQPEDRARVIELLASRAKFADLLLDEIALPKSAISAADLTASHAMQICNLGDQQLIDKLQRTWGTIQVSSAQHQQEIQDWTKRLSPAELVYADRSSGRIVFDKLCAQCHRLFGAGITVGPDLTGSQRNDLHYLLSNIIDPSAVVDKSYRSTLVVTKDGRAVQGLVIHRRDDSLTLRTATDEITLRMDEVDQLQLLNGSAMPEGLLQNLQPQQVRDLIGYLISPVQVEPTPQK